MWAKLAGVAARAFLSRYQLRLKLKPQLWFWFQFQFQFQLRRQSSQGTRSVKSNNASTMQSLDAAAVRGFKGNAAKDDLVVEPCFHFTPGQERELEQGRGGWVRDTRIGDLVAEKTARGEFFYGIEITGRDQGKPTCVNFNHLLPVLPTFISLVWLPSYWKVEPLEMVETLQFLRVLQRRIPVLPHFTPYRATKQRIDQFLALNYSNMLAVRGDRVDEDQHFLATHELVKYARLRRGDNFTIAAAAHPLGYLDHKRGLLGKEESICLLKQKVDSGVDFLITQICYDAATTVDFLRELRRAGVEQPVMVGVVVPESYANYKLMESISKASLPAEEAAKLEQLKDDNDQVRNFFVQLTVCLIQTVLDAKLGAQGIEIFTMNSFGSVIQLLGELRQLGILKEPAMDNDGH